jgi:DNA topoisomerase-1
MTLDTVTYEDALALLSFPRTLGTNSAGEEITVQNGRYGPYLKAGADSRTLPSEDHLFTMTLEEALDIYSRPKERRRGVAKPPVKELGIDPTSQKALIIKDGRFGMYVTDGETNATLRRGDTAEGMTLDRGLELLAGRRAWEAENGPSPKKTRKKAAALDKKGSAKKGDTAPTLTKNVVRKAGAKKAAKKAASGKAKKKAE